MSDEPARREIPWCPSWNIKQASAIPVINQAERELLMFVELCAPENSKHRLASLVTNLCAYAESLFQPLTDSIKSGETSELEPTKEAL